MIWKRLKKSTPEQDAEFKERFKEEKVGIKDTFAMVLAAFVTIVLPCALVLIALSAFCLWLFGAI